ncbi:MAG: hypothetical protein AAF711_19335 [Planctomycetota bacterium]
MNRIQTACFCLLASAFVLTAVLLVRIDEKSAPNAAHADGQVIAQPAFTMMTARTRSGGGGDDIADESLFILDNNAGVLVVYAPNISRKQLTPVAGIKMTEIFGRN